MTIAAIDQGTTSTRALALQPDGSATVVKAVEHRQIYPRPGWVEHDPEELVANIRAFADAVNKAKPTGAKGTFVKRIAVTSTMGPGVKVEPASLGSA